MALSSANCTDATVTNYRTAINDSESFLYDENSFQRVLGRELERAKYSKKPFTLMLISLEALSRGRNGAQSCRDVTQSLASSLMQRDALGWYKSGQILGIIFAEQSNPLENTVGAITRRVNTGLAASLCPEDITKLSIALYLFPRKSGRTALHPVIGSGMVPGEPALATAV